MDWKTDESGCVKEFLSNGLVSLVGVPALSAEEVKACKDASCARFDELRQRLDFLSNVHGSHPSTGNGTVEIVERDGARFDMRYRMDEDPFRSLAERGPWKSLVSRLLGGQAKLMWAGVVVAKGEEDGGGGPQAWHRDGEHLFEERHCPPHCINVFVPLVDVNASNGSTEFVPGSHVLGHGNTPEPTSAICKPSINAGEALLFDYRCVHRGGANTSREDRHVLYFTYAREWFVDVQNHRSLTSLFDETFDFSAKHVVRAEFEACLAADLMAKKICADGQDSTRTGKSGVEMQSGSVDDANCSDSFETEIALGDITHTLRIPINGLTAAVQRFCTEHQLPPEFATHLEAQLMDVLPASGGGPEEEPGAGLDSARELEPAPCEPEPAASVTGVDLDGADSEAATVAVLRNTHLARVLL